MTLDYNQRHRQALAAYLGTSAMHKAAIASGVLSYAVPICGAGFTDHRRSTASGRCIDCARIGRAKDKERLKNKAETTAAAIAKWKAQMEAMKDHPTK